MTYKINTSSLSLAPAIVRYAPIPIGVAHTRQTIYSGDYDVTLEFEESSPASALQWLDAVSSGSVNVTILNKLSVEFTDLSGVYFDVVNYPHMESIYASPFSLIIRGVYIT